VPHEVAEQFASISRNLCSLQMLIFLQMDHIKRAKDILNFAIGILIIELPELSWGFNKKK
jgi:hypothetical protein